MGNLQRATATVTVLVGLTMADACLYKSDSESDSGDLSTGMDSASTTGDEESDTDTDTETDTDTDADADTDSSGPLELYMVMDVAGQELDDVCSGSMTALDDGTSIAGTGTCEFASALQAFAPGPISGMLSGEISGSTASGTYELNLVGTPLDLSWSGSVRNREVRGQMAGRDSFVVGGTTVDFSYEGAFEYER